MRRSTFVVSDRLADRRLRDQIALERRQGQRVLTLAGLTARLAGGFGGVVAASEVRQALQAPPLEALTSLRSIAELPGFARAAAATLRAAWHADIDLAAKAAEAGAHERWAELAALEAHVAAQMQPGTMLPRTLVAAALARVHLAPRLLGDVTLERVDDVPPIYRHLLTAVADHVPVVWRRLDAAVPAWVPPGITCVAPETHAPERSVVSCADPAHEALEALRWARELLARGVPAHDIAVGAVDVGAYDDAIRTLSATADLPLHAVNGVAALATPAGQFAAAFADALLHGPNQERVRRIVAAACATGDPGIGALPDEWCAKVNPDAALNSAPHWRRALEELEAASPHLAQLVLRLVEDLAVGPAGAVTAGERWLSGDARAMWRHALTEGPAAALASSLQRLRVSDGVDPAAAVVWGSAAALLGWPRRHVRLLGLSARSWPRRGSDEDPLLPARILGDEVLTERTTARRDSEHLLALLVATSGEVVLSRPRRGSDGRKQTPNPLLRRLLAGVQEEERIPRAGASHALNEADRRASRRLELSTDPVMLRARRAFRAPFTPELNEHDGLVRAEHPVVVRALGRRHSATSLRKLLRNPHGFVATYALGWTQPQPQREMLALEPVDFGSLLHEVLEAALDALERGGGMGAHTEESVSELLAQTCAEIGERWELARPVPPPLAWRAQLRRAARVALEMLTRVGEPFPNQRSYAELKFGYDAADSQDGAALPWRPDAVVTLPGTDLRLRGVIDRLDIDPESRHVRVIDYKSGKTKKFDDDLDEGRELQRTLYTIVARQLLGEEYTVEAGLLYGGAEAPVTLIDPEASVERLSAAVQEAITLLRGGQAMPGPGVTDPFEETVLAYPSTGTAYYYRTKEGAISPQRAALDRHLGITA